MLQFRPSTADDIPRIMAIWRNAVDATHHFLTPRDRAAIDAELCAFFPQITLTLALESNGNIVGFMYLHHGHLEALFVDADSHGKGIGRALIGAALARYPQLTTDVNEQNVQALAFYQRLGFVRTGRSALDGQGRAYPLLHLQYLSPL
ncbi:MULTISPECIES: acetyltransferase [unclassified Symbiopectobacterium]|uniref:acetyltransferase n=1 Tax=unclassified Symbiopectobacterium TaxID=2794573 RepID=UPI002227B41E|nr:MULTISPECIES: acetyltransferase [unclassified Symbiopectobacterium]MCW2473964.1 acetyltransferase [Candidatus Symbiopectobacterium sp. NZEC151]MCW2482691.1 acetyltransferase [Candidatus Symbiopectobacterium sp. NZEC135]